jgi:HEAT repeat protein
MRFQWRTRPVALPLALAVCVAASIGSARAQTPRQISTDSLIYDLKNPDAGRRTDAARQLGMAKFTPAIPALLPLAEDPDAGVRRQLELTFEDMGDIKVLPGLVQLSADSEPDIRGRAVHALVDLHLPRAAGASGALTKFGNFINPWSDEYGDVVVEPDVPVDPSVVDALRARLTDTEDSIRRSAGRGLGVLKGSAAIPELIQTIREDRDTEVRFECVRALKKIGDPAVGDRLLPALNLDIDKVRLEVIATLGALRYRGAVADLTRVFEGAKASDRARPLALSALADIGAPDSRALFLGNKNDKDAVIRTYANEGLARLNDPSLLTVISADRLTEKNARVQVAQAFGLLRLGRKEYLDEMVRALDKLGTKDLAREYLIETSAADRPALFMARPKGLVARVELAETFGLMGDKGALTALAEFQGDKDPNVVQAAERAIRRINAAPKFD